MKIVNKCPSSPEPLRMKDRALGDSKPHPLRVKDCALGDVVTVHGCPDNYYHVALLNHRVYGVNLKGGGYVDRETKVNGKVCAEVHVTGVEPV